MPEIQRWSVFLEAIEHDGCSIGVTRRACASVSIIIVVLLLLVAQPGHVIVRVNELSLLVGEITVEQQRLRSRHTNGFLDSVAELLLSGDFKFQMGATFGRAIDNLATPKMLRNDVNVQRQRGSRIDLPAGRARTRARASAVSLGCR